MKKECKFIRADNMIYVPAPNSWLEGWVRQRWLERYFGIKIRIKSVSLEYWKSLLKNNKAFNLIYNNNTFSEEIL